MVAAKENTKNKVKINKVRNGPKPGKIAKTKAAKPEPVPVPTKVKKALTNVALNTETTKKIHDYTMPSASVTKDVVKACVSAVLKLSENHKKSNRLLDDDTAIFAEIRCMKIQNTIGNISFVLPHSTVASTGEVCLITPDLKKGRKVDHEPTVDHWQELLRKAGVTNVKTVLPMRQLRVEYDQYELKRRLLTQHDMIIVDTRVLNHVSHLLGKMFFKKHNMLIPVRVNDKDDESLKKSIDKGVKTTVLRLNIGETSTVLVGHTGMPKKHVEENVMALVEQLKKFPGKEKNIRAISLKLPLSLSVPLYLTLRPSNSVHAPRIIHKKPKNFVDVEDELSTMPGCRVTVAPDGTVRVKRTHAEDSDMEEGDEQGSVQEAVSEAEEQSE